jgi:hypothetical protein
VVGQNSVPKGTFEDFISVKIFRYFLLVIIKCASFQASKIEPVSLPIDWYVEYHSDSRSLLHDVESGLLTQRHTDVPLERKEKENSTDKNLIAPSTRGPTVDTCPMARRSTRVPWPIPAHTRTFQKEAPRKKTHGTFPPFFRPPRGPTPRRTKSRAISNHSRWRDSGARSDS